MVRYIIRSAKMDDIEGLQSLARMLDTVNLPDDPKGLRDVLELSVNSFTGAISQPAEREYVFVLEDLVAKKIVGSSQVIAQHGTRDAPHIFFEVGMAERYSNSIDKHYKHQVLRLGYNYDGPTEIGGLIVDPDYRHVPEKLGRQLSLVRFLFIAMNQSLFQDRVLAELLPPFLENRQSLLWECLGRRFTGLEYHEADHLSRTNKEFITGLFPAGQIYTCLFDEAVRNTIGAVGPESLPAKHMLEGIGFTYQNRVDPFDGGPHFEALCEDVEPIQNSELKTLCVTCDTLRDSQPWLVASFRNAFQKNVEFRAAIIWAQEDSVGQKLWCTGEDIEALGLSHLEQAWAYRTQKPS